MSLEMQITPLACPPKNFDLDHGAPHCAAPRFYRNYRAQVEEPGA